MEFTYYRITFSNDAYHDIANVHANTVDAAIVAARRIVAGKGKVSVQIGDSDREYTVGEARKLERSGKNNE